jgi:hypothetical protein
MAVAVPVVAANGSQRLRGLGGRTFQVHVTGTLGPRSVDYTSCYTFFDDGSWIDPRLPIPGGAVLGSWSTRSNGAKTNYVATVRAGQGDIVSTRVDQTGKVSPKGGKGVLQLSAVSEMFLVVRGADEVKLGTLQAVGAENPNC